MKDFKEQMQQQYIQYASYVILDRAIPAIIDGLKPVQRRILYMLWKMHDGKLHKVANVAGQTMVLHPHGDAAIIEALVNIANKGYFLDRQGNFGNLFTGDPSAAARYIETRLSPLARETLFNPDLTSYLPSYDGRNDEPICLPAKIPVVLLQGTDGIAVGMATHIFPHNFKELLEAEISCIEDKPFSILPDFPTGGIMDATDYDKGRGKVRLRAKMEVRDPKTILIKEICYGTTTESLIRSIDEAAKKGRLKLEAINDYTAEKVEIEIRLPRGVYAQDVMDALYAYTECQVSLSSQVIVIKGQRPWESDVDSLLRFHAQQLQDFLRIELEIEAKNLLENIFEKTLERIFIENRLYHKIEKEESYDKIHSAIETSLVPFLTQLSRVPTYDDREKLLNIPIRRISRFDLTKNQDDIRSYQKSLAQVDKDLKQIKKVAVNYLQNLIKKYAKDYPRKTEIQAIGEIDTKAMETKQIKVGYDPATGFIGTKVAGEHQLDCTNFDKLLVLFKDGTYVVMNIQEKFYLKSEKNKVVFLGIADKKTVFSVAYRDPKTNFEFGKRFIVEKFILDKEYRYLEEGMKLDYFSPDPSNTLRLEFVPKPKQKVSSVNVKLNDIAVKGVSAKGVKLAAKEVQKVVRCAEST